MADLLAVLASCKELWLEVIRMLAVSFWVGQIIGQTIGTIVALYFLPNLLAVSFLAFQILNVLWPLGKAPWLMERFLNFSVQSAMQYFSLKVICEDYDAIKPDQTYVVGLEPHSALPTALPMMFNKYCQALPKALQDIKVLATSTVFYLPATRHPWYWLGIRSIDRDTFHSLLAAQNSVVLVPGGVSECMLMKKGQEVMYLTKRTGFVRIALNHGAHLLPCFAFGQSGTYSWLRPGPPLIPNMVVETVRKWLGFIPLIMWGRWGTTIPHKVPMLVVFGKPIELPKMEHPSKEEIQKYLQLYINAMQALCQKHKDSAGYGGTTFQVV